MDFRKYMHVERFGKTAVKGIEEGSCYVFPKIDGTNASIWKNAADEICCGSRNQSIGKGASNQGFGPDHVDVDLWQKVVEVFKDCTIYGEWLVPHSLRTYSDDAWRKFYVFDVMNAEGQYLPFSQYNQPLLDLGVEVIQPLMIIDNPTEEELQNIANTANKFLIKEGEGVGEGVVVKNYDFRNRFGHVVWAKVLANTYKNKGNAKGKINAPTGPKKDTENYGVKFLEKYFDDTFIEKEIHKLLNTAEPLDGQDFDRKKMMPIMMFNILKTCVEEELFEFLAKHKMPSIDFTQMKKLSDKRVIDVLRKNHLL